MTHVTTVNEATLEGLARFGYSEREAAFLTLVADHSGYFVRRQFAQFVGKPLAGTATALIEKAIENEHLTVSTYVGNLHLYHLSARPAYAAIGHGDNRNRRERQPLTIKSKLMALDFVLEHPMPRYLASEREKVDYFTQTLGLARERLPGKVYHARQGTDAVTRYFVEKYPISIAPEQNGERLEISFSYIDAGATSVSGFETFLDRYRPLLQALPLVRVVYVATRPLLFEAAERLFHRLCRRPSTGIGAPHPVAPAHLQPYFETRFLYETGDLSTFDRAKLIALRDQRRELSGSNIDALYAQWRSAREHAANSVSEHETAALAPLRGALSVCLLHHNYDVFGSLTAF